MRIINVIYRFLSSMKTGLILLAMIGIMSAIGTGLLPDNFYHSFWFKFLLLLLLLNMSTCTINQLARYLTNRLKQNGSKRSSFRPIGLLLLHAGVVLVLIGGTINSFNGQSESLKIVQGDEIDISTVIRKANPFSIKLDEFKIEFNADGSPSQYYSNVSIAEGGSASKPYSISVNNPLEYRGVKAYQSSFGYLVDVRGRSNSGWMENKILEEGGILEITDTDKALMIYKYIPDFDPQFGMASKSLKPDNPRIVYSVYQKGSLLNVGAASFGEEIEIEPDTYVKFSGTKPYTVLTIKRDPGLSLVALGGLMLMLGVCLALVLKVKKQGDVL